MHPFYRDAHALPAIDAMGSLRICLIIATFIIHPMALTVEGLPPRP